MALILQHITNFHYVKVASEKANEREIYCGQLIIFSQDEPSKPGRPDAKNWDKDFVDLEWTAPKNDGGAPIEKYIIQMRDKEGRAWVDAATVPGNR